MRKWRLTICLFACVILSVLNINLAFSAEEGKKTAKNIGKDTYMSNCEACHMMGKNVIKPGKDIVVSSKLASLDQFKDFLSEPHGVMPCFKKIADDSDVVSALYKYTKKLKNQNWSYELPQEDQPSEPTPPPEQKKRGDSSRPTG